jgi:sugar/nucleoside kinase (ribokinase family)
VAGLDVSLGLHLDDMGRSDEDLGRRRDQLDIWSRDVPIVALTRYRRGATIIERGVARSMPAFPTDERDPTGAGDVFAAAFLIHYYESERVDEAARFAAAAAACSVEGESFDAIASRDAIEARMAQHPEVALR